MAGPLRYGDWLPRFESAGPVGPHFFCGPESLLRDQAFCLLKRKLFGEAEEARLAQDRFQGGEGPLSQVTASLASVGLFTGTRLVLLADAEKSGRASSVDRRDLLELLHRGTPGAVFVATSELTVRELERKNEFTKGLLQACQVVEVGHPTPAEALRWLLGECRRRTLHLEADAATFLLSRVGPDLQELSRELEKLELWSDPGEHIGLDKVREMVHRGQLGTGWEFCAALLEGRVPEGLRQWGALAGTEPVLRTQWLLQRQARDRLGRGARGAEPESLTAILRQAYELEWGVKSGAIPSGQDGTALELMVVSTGSRRPRERRQPNTSG